MLSLAALPIERASVESRRPCENVSIKPTVQHIGHPRNATRAATPAPKDSQGCANKKMAAILNLSVKTVESHRATAMRKLSVTSTVGLLRYAVRNNLVQP